jgi:simple sugar transport system permease protein
MSTASKDAAAPMPRWLDLFGLPVVNLMLALIVSGLIVLAVGENPFSAIRVMAVGAFGDLGALGYTLYYATNFIFTGLAVAVAFHAGLFNIGGEGQAYIGGLGAGLAALAFDHSLTLWPMLILGLVASAAFGAAWAFVPAYLQAKRGSHIVITTIMFNLIAASLMVYLLVNVFKLPGSMEVVSRGFEPSAGVPYVNTLLAEIGIEMPQTPLNLTFVWALICCGLVWLYLWRSRGGYELRTTGLSPKAALYAGISPTRVTIEAMLVSGALAGFLGFNEVMGNHRQLVLDIVAGAGFTGIAVALMGRNHPFGIILASILFGALYQGGGELAFEFPTLNRDMIVVMQGLVILFSGALAYMNRPLLERGWRFYQARRQAKPATTTAVAPVTPAAAPDAPVALAQETVAQAALPAPVAPAVAVAVAPTPAPTPPAPAPAAEPLEVVEAEIVTMGPDTGPAGAPDKLSWLKKSGGAPEPAAVNPSAAPAAATPPATPKKKRGPKKSKRKPGEA